MGQQDLVSLKYFFSNLPYIGIGISRGIAHDVLYLTGVHFLLQIRGIKAFETLKSPFCNYKPYCGRLILDEARQMEEDTWKLRNPDD